MKPRDRRIARRITMHEHMGARVAARLDGQTVSAPVIDLSERGIRVQLDVAAPRPKVGTEVESAQLLVPGRPVLPLSRVFVRAAVVEKTGVFITFLTDDPTSKAKLWHAIEQYTSLGKKHHDATQVEVPASLPRLPGRGVYTEQSRLERLAFLREQTQTSLAALQETRLQAEKLTGNIENMIGAIEVPVGIAGPLVFHGHAAKGVIYAPLATSEGALVASCTRGATAIAESGGVTTRVIGQRMMRAPMFQLSRLDGAFMFASWVRDHVEQLREQTRMVSRYANLISVEPIIIGRMVHVHFLYETADAAGQNMTTACTWHACQWLMEQIKYFDEIEFEQFTLDGNTSGDKKVTFNSFINGRGIRVVADCVISRAVLEKVLKTTPERLVDGYHQSVAGAIHSGMIGANVNVANTVAAIFAATGQDIACVHESSVGQLHLEKVPEGVYASLNLPSLVIGTVGGGTHLPAQQALLQMMGCSGPNKVFRLAEIIAGFALSLDLSTASAMASGEFASAHERLGRNRPVRWFEQQDLSPDFFEEGVKKVTGKQDVKLTAVEPMNVALGSSIVTELTARKVKKLVGLFPLRLVHNHADDGPPPATEVLVKVKPLDEEVVLMANSMAAMCGPRLAAAYQKFRHRLGQAGCHVRELAIYEQTDERFTAHVPKIFRTFRDDKREAFVVVMERLKDMTLLDTADDPKGWSRRYIEVVLKDLGKLHAVWLGREAELAKQPWIGIPPTTAGMIEMAELWDAMAVHASQEFPTLMGAAELERVRGYVRTLPEWWGRLERMPRTLIHNDFNPRNVAIRDHEEARLCAYDWELATINVPQHDMAEFLCFVLPPTVSKRIVNQLIEVHRTALEEASGQVLDKAEWRAGYHYALRDLALNRFGLYLMAHTFRHYKFMDRTVKTLWRLLALEEDELAEGSRG